MSKPSPNDVAGAWLASLDSALTRRDLDAAIALFGDDCYWRDLARACS